MKTLFSIFLSYCAPVGARCVVGALFGVLVNLLFGALFGTDTSVMVGCVIGVGAAFLSLTIFPLHKFVLISMDLNGTIFLFDAADKDVDLDQRADEITAKSVWGWSFMTTKEGTMNVDYTNPHIHHYHDTAFDIATEAGEDGSPFPVWIPAPWGCPRYAKPHPNATWENFNDFGKTLAKHYEGDRTYKDYSYAFTKSRWGERYRPVRNMVHRDLSAGKRIFKSFLNLAEYLRRLRIPHKFVYRTFGSDGDYIRDKLMEYGVIGCGETVKSVVIGDIDRDLRRIESDLLGHSHVFVRDDYSYWSSHGRASTAGKPIVMYNAYPSWTRSSSIGQYIISVLRWILGSVIISVGFDDNTCMYACDELGNHVPSHDHHVRHINSVKALDPEYYIHEFQKTMGEIHAHGTN